MSQLTGIVYVKVDGELQRSEDGARLSLGGKERTARTGHSVYGYSEKVVPSIISFELPHAGGDDLVGLQNKVDSTMEYITDTGDTYMIRNAFAVKPAELTGGDSGTVSMEFNGDPAELI